MTLRDRIGFDAGAMRIQDALEWATVHHMAFGSLEDKLEGRELFAACLDDG